MDQSVAHSMCRGELTTARRQLQDTQAELSKGQATMRATEAQLQELRSKLAGFEETQRSYQARTGHGVEHRRHTGLTYISQRDDSMLALCRVDCRGFSRPLCMAPGLLLDRIVPTVCI